jgi:hypothetical protein
MRTAEQQSLTVLSLDARLFRRRVLMSAHAVVGAASAVIYLSGINFAHDAWWARSIPRLILFAAPVLLPYAISARHCWRLDTWEQSGPSRLRVTGFIALVIAGAVVINAALLGVLGPLGPLDFLKLLVLQAAAYLWGAELILEVI